MTFSSDRELSASEAAWLLRLNDDTVRRWFKQDDFPLLPDVDPAAVRWSDLDDWCVVHRRPRPFDAALLDAAPEAVTLSVAQSESTQPSARSSPESPIPAVVEEQPELDAKVQLERLRGEVATLKDALERSMRREQAWRLVVRERIVSAAAADRALTHLLDAAGEAGPASN